MKFLFSIIVALAVSAFAQQAPPTIEAQSTGECSPNILSTQGKVEFTCNTSMDEATAKKIVSLLNQILRREGNSADVTVEIDHKVDEILAFVKSHTSTPTIQGIELKAVYECEIAVNKQPPSSGAYHVVSNAGAVLKGNKPISLELTPNVYVAADKDDKNAAIVAETFVLPAGSIQGQPIQILDGVRGAEVKMLWDGGGWCGRPTGALISIWVNGYRALYPTKAMMQTPTGGYADIEADFSLQDQLKAIKW
jgi:hypothetical protein